MILGPQSLDSSRDYTITLNSNDGSSLAGLFTGSESFSTRVWPGSDQSPSWTSTGAVTWIDHTLASPTLKLNVPASALTGFLPGRYFVEIRINPGSDNVQALPYGSLLWVTAAPGSGTPGKVYCEYRDCVKLAPWIEDVLYDNPTLSPLMLDQRVEAREWFDLLIQRHWRGGVSLGAEGGLLWRRRTGLRNKWLQDQLDADTLLVTDRIRRCVACYALSLTLAYLIGRDGKTAYQEMAIQYAAQAEHLASTITCELDTNADGWGEYAVDLGFIDVLQG